jgi:hypothetical protein
MTRIICIVRVVGRTTMQNSVVVLQIKGELRPEKSGSWLPFLRLKNLRPPGEIGGR